MLAQISYTQFRVLEFVRENPGVTIGVVKKEFGATAAAMAITALGLSFGLILFLGEKDEDGDYPDDCPLRVKEGVEVLSSDAEEEVLVPTPSVPRTPLKQKRKREPMTDAQRAALNRRQLSARHERRTPRWTTR